MRKFVFVAIAGLALLLLVGIAGRLNRLAPVEDMSDEKLLALTRTLRESGGDMPRESTGFLDAPPVPHTREYNESGPATAPAPARVPTREERLEHFAKDSKWTTEHTEWKMTIISTYLRGLRSADCIMGLMSPNMADRYAPDIAWHSLTTGDLTTAKHYLGHALQTESDPKFRRYMCGRLAWLVDDPEVAGTLLEAACAENDYLEIRNAVEYSQAVQDEALEEFYQERSSVDHKNLIIYRGWLGAL